MIRKKFPSGFGSRVEFARIMLKYVEKTHFVSGFVKDFDRNYQYFLLYILF